MAEVASVSRDEVIQFPTQNLEKNAPDDPTTIKTQSVARASLALLRLRENCNLEKIQGCTERLHGERNQLRLLEKLETVLIRNKDNKMTDEMVDLMHRLRVEKFDLLDGKADEMITGKSIPKGMTDYWINEIKLQHSDLTRSISIAPADLQRETAWMQQILDSVRKISESETRINQEAVDNYRKS